MDTGRGTYNARAFVCASANYVSLFVPYNQVTLLLQLVKDQKDESQHVKSGVCWAPIATALHRTTKSCTEKFRFEQKGLKHMSVLERVIKTRNSTHWTDEMVIDL